MRESIRPLAVLACLTVAVLTAPFFDRAEAAHDKKVEPEMVKVQHVLIAFKGSVPGQKIERTKKEAEALANEVLKRAKGGEDFTKLVEQYSADRAPGVLRLLNKGVPRMTGCVERDGVVPGFGDAAFGIEVGEIVLVEYGVRDSPYGWHVIKRLE